MPGKQSRRTKAQTRGGSGTGKPDDNNIALRDSILKKRIYCRVMRKIFVEVEGQYTPEEQAYKVKEDRFITAILSGT